MIMGTILIEKWYPVGLVRLTQPTTTNVGYRCRSTQPTILPLMGLKGTRLKDNGTSIDRVDIGLRLCYMTILWNH